MAPDIEHAMRTIETLSERLLDAADREDASSAQDLGAAFEASIAHLQTAIAARADTDLESLIVRFAEVAARHRQTGDALCRARDAAAAELRSVSRRHSAAAAYLDHSAIR